MINRRVSRKVRTRLACYVYETSHREDKGLGVAWNTRRERDRYLGLNLEDSSM